MGAGNPAHSPLSTAWVQILSLGDPDLSGVPQVLSAKGAGWWELHRAHAGLLGVPQASS